MSTPIEDDPEVPAHLIQLAASNHDVAALRPLLRQGSANVRDSDTGYTPLHSAIAACEDDGDSHGVDKENHVNGHVDTDGATNGETTDAKGPEMTDAAKTVKLLLQQGAIWNDLNKDNETPGCIALKLHLDDLYEIMVDAGVRAELLLNRLDEYEQLQDEEDSETESGPAISSSNDHESNPDITLQTPEGDADIPVLATNEAEPDEQLGNEDFLNSSLRFQGDRILDESGNGVMMAWESNIMKRTADLLCPDPGFHVLNVGHGMGIVDNFFQTKLLATHHIIEAHPAVLQRMRKDGWFDKPNVVIHEGRWQDVVPHMMEQGILFDAIYFDTFAEDYKAFRDFFSDFLVGLLKDQGKWGFFNGLGADRQICYGSLPRYVGKMIQSLVTKSSGSDC